MNVCDFHRWGLFILIKFIKFFWKLKKLFSSRSNILFSQIKQMINYLIMVVLWEGVDVE